MDNCVSTTKKLLKLLGIGHTTRFLEDAILSHPDHPSLLCIADTLEKYHIENLAVKIDGDKLQEVPLPCIVQVSERGNRVFSVLEQLSDNQVCHLNSDGKRNELTKEEFLKKWTGICLLAEKSKESVEPGIEKRLYTQSIMTFLTAAVTALLILSSILTFTNSEIIGNNDLTIYSIAYSLLKVVGLGTGILLLWYEVDQYNPTLQSFCSGGGKINCNAVLNSDKAQLLNGNLSLSLLGFSYFFASLGFLLFSGFDATSFGALGILSLTMFPWSYYRPIIKRWSSNNGANSV